MTPEEENILDDLIERGELEISPYAAMLRSLARGGRTDTFGEAIRALTAYLKVLLDGGDVIIARQQFLEAVEGMIDQEWAEILIGVASALDQLIEQGFPSERGGSK